MPRRIAQSNLNARTIDILNVIRANASYEYQSEVPKVEKSTDIPKVGEILVGTPSLANQFINALVNRIALVRVSGATFNNPYSVLKKGYIQFGETIEEIFIGIINALPYSAEKGEAREHKRFIPDVKSAFHVMNWRVVYPVTIQEDDLQTSFLSEDGVTNLIGKIVDSVYTSAEYDEFLLFKYMIIKSISKGLLKPYPAGAPDDDESAAIAFRGVSNSLTFMSNKNNEFGVKTNTPKSRQIIFMDSMYNSQFDVNVLARAFNMEKADFMGRLFLIDNFTEFDNERFNIIREMSDGFEEVTEEELNLLIGVKACMFDEDWFQIYDNKNKFTEKYTAAGLYWNYFYHVWKTVSHSPFANAVVFCDTGVIPTQPTSLEFVITAIDKTDKSTVYSLNLKEKTSLAVQSYEFIQTEDCVKNLVAVQKWGGLIVPNTVTSINLSVMCDGKVYNSTSPLTPTEAVGDTIEFTTNVAKRIKK